MIMSMRAFLLLRLLTVAAITTSIGSCNANQGLPACRASEKQALLIFKRDLTDPSNRLSSWVADEDSDCCHWAGVVCHHSTGRIHELHLDNPDYLVHPNSSLGGKINPSLLNLTHLTYLNLSQNDFQGTQIPSFFGSLKNLTQLDLTQARFQGLIPPQLGNLSSLLFLAGNCDSLKVENLHWLSGLSRLQPLDMSYVNLSKASDHWLLVINMLPSLVELQMHDCELDHIPSLPIINFTSLAILDLSWNRFSSLMPGWVFSLRNIVSLHLVDCDFLGPIPSSHNSTSIREIDLSLNFLNDSIPEWLYSLNHLESFFLSNNDFQGEISRSVGNLTSIINLDLKDNLFEGTIPKSLGNLCKLTVLDLSLNQFTVERLSDIIETLSECASNRVKSLSFSSLNISGQLPELVGTFTNLRALDLSNNSISGPIPVSLVNLSCLETLDISQNQFNGTLPESIGQLNMLNILDISYNSLEGAVSEVHFTCLTSLSSLVGNGNSLMLNTSRDWIPPFKLVDLKLDSWHLGPEFPIWIQGQDYLWVLSLSSTGLSGVIPTWVWNSTFQLDYLNLSHNQLHGEVQSLVANKFSIIDLSSNLFTGSLPLVSSNVSVLDLSNSSFSGTVSHFFCDTRDGPKRLKLLHLGNNHLNGRIPDCWMNWKSLKVVNLENNNLSGNIPSSIGYLLDLISVHLRNNQLSGELPLSLQNCTQLLVVDLRVNKLEGSLPTWIGESLLKLVVLNLRSNKLQGDIPHELCNLTYLQVLDIANNNLSGAIPRCFNNLSAMKNLSKSSSLTFLDITNEGIVSSFGVVRYEIYEDNAIVVTKGKEVQYSRILRFVRIMDISVNIISGEIPEELTSLDALQTLNLSNNLLTGKIPSKIGNLSRLETLDLSKNHLFFLVKSKNHLVGVIPASMRSMTFLNHLNLSYNNLRGHIPESTQLQSFDQSSFVGNKFVDLLSSRLAVQAR